MHILLIARHFPPEISGGARRPFLLTEALRLQGHKVTVVTPFKLDAPDHICVQNKAINNSLQTQSSTTNAHFSKMGLFDHLKNQIRQWMFWPDPDIRWARDVLKVLQDTNLTPDWIITTSPPESLHIVGATLTQYWDVPWLAEMRDTWVSMPHRVILERSKIRAFFERRIATKTLSAAAAITSVSEAVMSEARIYCSPNTPELILPHFSKPANDDAVGTNNNIPKFEKRYLNIVHTGGFSLSDRRRKLNPLLDVIGLASKKRPEITLHIVGPLTQLEIAMLKNTAVRTVHHGYMSIQNSHAMQRQADGLLLYTPQNSHALPGKCAEYILAGRPILYFGGGSWLSLIQNKVALRPLVPGLMALKKGEIIKPKNAFTHLMAAKILTQFLNNVTT